MPLKTAGKNDVCFIYTRLDDVIFTIKKRKLTGREHVHPVTFFGGLVYAYFVR